MTADELKKYIDEMTRLQNSVTETSSSADKLLQVYKEIAKIEANRRQISKEKLNLEKQNAALLDKLNDKNNKVSTQEAKKIRDTIKANKELIDIANQKLDATKKILDENKEILDNISQQKKAYLFIKDKLLKPIGKIYKQHVGYYDDQIKALRETQLNIGLYSKQASALNNTLMRSALNTQMIGVSTKDLAEMQSTYNDEVGRSLMFNQAQAEAVAQIAKGTALGTSGSAQLVAQFDNLNISAERTRDLIENTLNYASRTGVTASKAAKSLESALRLSQKYRFINGVKDAMDMAVYSAKFKMNMEGVSGMAENLLNPEGAVDMAAQLQVLGGQWSQLADPFSLMFKARNDFKGLVEDVTKATLGMGELNKETGEIELSAIEMHRLREVAKVTGMQFEDLLKTTREFNKAATIKRNINANIDDGLKDFISSTAIFDENKKEFFINLPNEFNQLMPVFISELGKYPKDLNEVLKQEDKRLQDRAEANKTFDETINNLKNTAKQLLLPSFEVLDKAFTNLTINLTKTDLANKIKDFAMTVGKAVGVVADLMLSYPKLTTGLATFGLALGPLIDAGKWFLNGIQLSKGFLVGSKTGGFGTGMASSMAGKDGLTGKFGGQLKKMGRGGMMATGIGSLVGGIAGDRVGSSFSNYEDSGAGDMGSLIGSAALGALGMALGGPLGMMLGTAVGAGIGRATGNYFGGEKKEVNPNNISNDFVFRPGKDPMAFTEKDTLIGLKDGGPIEKSFGKLNGNSSSGAFNVSFDKPLKIEGSIKLEGNGVSKVADIESLLNNSVFVRNLTNIILENIAMVNNGSKLASSKS